MPHVVHFWPDVRGPAAVVEIPDTREPWEVLEMVRAKIHGPRAEVAPLETRGSTLKRMEPADYGTAGLSAESATGHTPRRGVRETSKRSYRALQYSGKLSQQQRKVVDSWRYNQDRTLTRQEIARITGLPINAVCGRVNELLTMEPPMLVEERQKQCPITKQMVGALELA